MSFIDYLQSSLDHSQATVRTSVDTTMNVNYQVTRLRCRGDSIKLLEHAAFICAAFSRKRLKNHRQCCLGLIVWALNVVLT